MVTSKFLDDELLSTPSLALDRVRMEFLHMSEHVQKMIDEIIPAILSGDRARLTAVEDHDNEVDILYEKIIEYLGNISKQSLTEKQTEELLQLMEAVGDLENIGDIIETNLVALGRERIEAQFSISKSTRKVLKDFHQEINRAYKIAIQAVSQDNKEAASTVIDMKDRINALARVAAAHQAERLIAPEPNRLKAYTTEVDIIEKQRRIFYFAKRMAKTVLPEGENGRF